MDDFRELVDKVKDREGLLEFLQQHMTQKRSRRFEEILKYRTRHFTLAVEDVYQERNASAIVRTADCFGVQDVHIIENYNLYQLSSNIAKGAEKWINIHIYDKKEENTASCIKQLRAKGYRIMATTPHKEDLLVDDIDIRQKSAFFFGGEKDGLSRTVFENADAFVKLPIYGFTESYNISVAAALLLQKLVEKLHRSDIEWQLTEKEKLDLRLDWTIKTVASSGSLIKEFLARETS